MPTLDVGGNRVNYRVSGSGVPVILLHSSSSHSGQWKALMEDLSENYRFFAPDLHGFGRSSPLPDDGQPYFVHDVAMLQAFVDLAGEPVHLVGHSLGGTVAAHAVLARPEQALSLTLIEPVLFNLIEEIGDPRVSDYLELVHAMLVLDRFQEYERSAGLFLDYWIGPGALAQLEPETRDYVVGTISRVADDWLGISQHTPGQCRVADFAGISMPALLVCGERTRSAARAIVECLLKTIPEAEYREIPAAGHLSPITHPEAVNKVIAGFLGRRHKEPRDVAVGRE